MPALLIMSQVRGNGPWWSGHSWQEQDLFPCQRREQQLVDKAYLPVASWKCRTHVSMVATLPLRVFVPGRGTGWH